MLSKMIACGLLGVAMAQQPGHQTKNVKPNIQYQTCTGPRGVFAARGAGRPWWPL